MPVVVITKVHRKIETRRAAEDGGGLDNSNSFASLCVLLLPFLPHSPRRPLANSYICVFHSIRANVRFGWRIFRELSTLILPYSNRQEHELWLQCNAFNMSICLSVCLFDGTANGTESKDNGSGNYVYHASGQSEEEGDGSVFIWVEAATVQENKGTDQNPANEHNENVCTVIVATSADMTGGHNLLVGLAWLGWIEFCSVVEWSDCIKDRWMDR